MCLTAVVGEGVDAADLCRRLGHDPAQLQLLLPGQAWELQDADDGWKHVLTFVPVAPGQVLLVEENGWQGSEERVLQLLSGSAGTAVSAYWNVNWDNRYSVAVGGAMLGSLDYLDLDKGGIPALAEDIELIKRVAENDPSGWKAGFVAALEARAGLSIDSQWWDRPHPTLVVETVLSP